MMKRLLILLLSPLILLCGCTQQPAEPDGAEPIDYTPVTEIDHCVVEPDERAVMTDADRAAYRQLMDAVLNRREEITLSGPLGAAFYLDLLRSSPYGYFLCDWQIDGDRVSFVYTYTAALQNEMLAYLDSEFLSLVNCDAEPDDNELDIILKVYSAVTHRLDYDQERTDNKELGSPLFDYPADEIYKALKNNKSLCYGFAYTLRFALLQRGIDCFCVYGECRAHEMGHEWVIFRYDDTFFHCDPSWDRESDGYAKLLHFGKTDSERAADTLVPRDFAEYHLPEYGEIVCADERFAVFRDSSRFYSLGNHRFHLENADGDSSVFDTVSFTVT